MERRQMRRRKTEDTMKEFFKMLFDKAKHAAIDAAHAMLDVLRSPQVQAFIKTELGQIVKAAVVAGKAAKDAAAATGSPLTNGQVRQQVFDAALKGAQGASIDVTESSLNLAIELIYNFLKIA